MVCPIRIDSSQTHVLGKYMINGKVGAHKRLQCLPNCVLFVELKIRIRRTRGLRNDVTYGISEGKNGYDELPEHK